MTDVPELWVEVDYTVVITEKGTAILKLTVPFDINDPATLLKAGEEVARIKSTTAIFDHDILKVDDIKSRIVTKCFYVDDGSGYPKRNAPITIDSIRELINDTTTDN